MRKDFSVIKANIKDLSESEEINKNILFAQIEEVVCLIEKRSLNCADAAKLFKDIFTLPFLSPAFMNFCNQLSMNDCFISTHKPIRESSLKSVSLTDNLYSKEAYQRFSSNELMTVDFENTFSSVCEAVYSKRSDYAILPLFNSRDGLLISIYRLLQKFDLKIVSSAKVLVIDSETETEFVLVCRNAVEDVVNDRIMISLTHSYDNTISDMLSAMKLAGAFPITINTLPLEYTDERCESLVTFDISQCRCDAVCAFIKTALPDANVVGIYSYVK